jgi:hypothetical protein
LSIIATVVQIVTIFESGDVYPYTYDITWICTTFDGERKLNVLIIYFMHSNIFNNFPKLFKVTRYRTIDRHGPTTFLVLCCNLSQKLKTKNVKITKKYTYVLHNRCSDVFISIFRFGIKCCRVGSSKSGTCHVVFEINKNCI